MNRHQQEVAELYELSKAKLPSDSTLRELVEQVEPLKVAEIFLSWAHQSLAVEVGDVISVDGKALARTLRDGQGRQQDLVTLVSACVQRGSWVIGQVSFQNGKSSEITSVRQLLQQLNLPGGVGDSRCLAHPKKTVCEMIESGNDYCIGLKANQPKLLQQAQQCAQTQAPLSQYASVDTSQGRVVERRVQVFAAPAQLSQDWAGLAALVSVQRTGMREGKAFERQAWFILSDVIEAERVAEMIQAHRGTTENQLHWVKDVVQGEDGSLIQSPHPATLMALLRSWAISVFRKAGHSSITKAIRLFQHDLPKLISFI